MLRLVVTAALPLWVALAPIADAAEPSGRIWDPDLKRYLTEEEIGKVEVYLTEEHALKLLFPKSQTIKAEELRLTPEQKARLRTLSPDAVTDETLAGEPIIDKLTRAPGNNAAIDGLKIVTASGWFAARPSGTESVYKIYAESFRDAAHLHALVSEAQTLVDAAIGGRS